MARRPAGGVGSNQYQTKGTSRQGARTDDADRVAAVFALGWDVGSADGHRESIGIVGVDAGTIAIASPPPLDPDETDFDHEHTRMPDDCIGKCEEWWTALSCDDGGYDVAVVRDDNGDVVAAEIIVQAPAIRREADKRLQERGLAGPSDEVYEASWAKDVETEEQHAAKMEALAVVEAYWQASTEAYNEAWDDLFSDLHPADEGTPHVLGQFTCHGELGFGDPFVAHSGMGGAAAPEDMTVKAKAGAWTAVAWTDGPSPKQRGAAQRLGVYLNPVG